MQAPTAACLTKLAWSQQDAAVLRLPCLNRAPAYAAEQQ
jgi:hypothetical protein